MFFYVLVCALHAFSSLFFQVAEGWKCASCGIGGTGSRYFHSTECYYELCPVCGKEQGQVRAFILLQDNQCKFISKRRGVNIVPPPVHGLRLSGG